MKTTTTLLVALLASTLLTSTALAQDNGGDQIVAPDMIQGPNLVKLSPERTRLLSIARKQADLESRFERIQVRWTKHSKKTRGDGLVGEDGIKALVGEDGKQLARVAQEARREVSILEKQPGVKKNARRRAAAKHLNKTLLRLDKKVQMLQSGKITEKQFAATLKGIKLELAAVDAQMKRLK